VTCSGLDGNIVGRSLRQAKQAKSQQNLKQHLRRTCFQAQEVEIMTFSCFINLTNERRPHDSLPPIASSLDCETPRYSNGPQAVRTVGQSAHKGHYFLEQTDHKTASKVRRPNSRFASSCPRRNVVGKLREARASGFGPMKPRFPPRVL
jgi:hypothetical protein